MAATQKMLGRAGLDVLSTTDLGESEGPKNSIGVVGKGVPGLGVDGPKETPRTAAGHASGAPAPPALGALAVLLGEHGVSASSIASAASVAKSAAAHVRKTSETGTGRRSIEIKRQAAVAQLARIPTTTRLLDDYSASTGNSHDSELTYMHSGAFAADAMCLYVEHVTGSFPRWDGFFPFTKVPLLASSAAEEGHLSRGVFLSNPTPSSAPINITRSPPRARSARTSVPRRSRRAHRTEDPADWAYAAPDATRAASPRRKAARRKCTSSWVRAPPVTVRNRCDACGASGREAACAEESVALPGVYLHRSDRRSHFCPHLPPPTPPPVEQSAANDLAAIAKAAVAHPLHQMRQGGTAAAASSRGGGAVAQQEEGRDGCGRSGILQAAPFVAVSTLWRPLLRAAAPTAAKSCPRNFGAKKNAPRSCSVLIGPTTAFRALEKAIS